jgi:hypothetical protein
MLKSETVTNHPPYSDLRISQLSQINQINFKSQFKENEDSSNFHLNSKSNNLKMGSLMGPSEF